MTPSLRSRLQSGFITRRFLECQFNCRHSRVHQSRLKHSTPAHNDTSGIRSTVDTHCHGLALNVLKTTLTSVGVSDILSRCLWIEIILTRILISCRVSGTAPEEVRI